MMMMFLVKIMKNNYYLIVGDIHAGKYKGDEKFLSILKNYGFWLKDICKSRNIKNIIFLGDIFDHRFHIKVEVMNAVTAFFDELAEYSIDICVGNHDCVYDNSPKVHSLCAFKNYSNINVHDQVCVKDGIAFCPWAVKLEDIPDCDYLMGHFDTVSFEVVKGHLSQHGFKAGDLMKKVGKACFSGHYHLYQERLYDSKPFIYTGSAYSLDFNDAGESKYVFLLDASANTVEKIENKESPKFKYVYDENDLYDIKGNYILAVNPTKELLSKIESSNPAMHKTRLVTKDIAKNVEDKSVEDFKLVDVVESIEKYCKELSNDDWKLDEEMKKKVAERMKVLYSLHRNY